MAGNWVLDVEQDSTKSDSCSIRLGFKDAQTGKIVSILSVASSGKAFDAFCKEISDLKGELDRLVENAREKIQGLEAQAGKKAAIDPGVIWHTMESLPSEDAMVEYFNGLGESERMHVAEYVFTHVSMFKGRGPLFSELYDSGTHLLEQGE